MSENSLPFNRDKFLRSLFMELRQAALDYKAKKDSTTNENLFLGPKPVMYDYFIQD